MHSMSNPKKSLGRAVRHHPIFLNARTSIFMFIVRIIAILLFGTTTYHNINLKNSLLYLNWEEKEKNSIITTTPDITATASSCPVKMFVYDLGFTNKTMHLKRGFHAETMQKKDYIFVTSEQSYQGGHPWFILHKFISSKHSHCTAKEAKDADFLILPLYNHHNVGEVDQVLHALEHHSEYNDTLFRRSQKDHILLNFHDTKYGREMTNRLKSRTKELIIPMVKVVVDVFLWGYDFQNRKRTDMAEVNFDRLLSMPYASNMREYSGDIHEQRPYLVSFTGNGNYPNYRKKIVQQCHDAMVDPARGDCYLAGSCVCESIYFLRCTHLIFHVEYMDGTFAMIFPSSAPLFFSETNRSKPPKNITFDSMYANSIFFFCPGGDTGPRKGLFDGIAVNSIPVLFEETSLDVTYPAYFPGNPRDYSIFLNTSSEDLMGQLRAIPMSRIKELRENIARVRDSLAYLPDADAQDATWVMMKELERFKQNGYKFVDPFPNKTTVYCVDKEEEFHGKCRFFS
eukprot:CAMPEP_0196130600 /NCGR_PEP_ID=MMETSP0910-20130528/916_1 /TAXON_ID=49265 /ORGANISM="Thalassiosira rotula, Strain GSO102" /LENGTH=511 /DNA_ID=CAMNT_0041389939 /DNA_START=277 /DNA_END=1812 /DNA_ORIENTATION=-